MRLKYKEIYPPDEGAEVCTPIDEYGVFADTNGTIWIDDAYVADAFGKTLAELRDIICDMPCKDEFRREHYALYLLIDDKGDCDVRSAMSRSGFEFALSEFAGGNYRMAGIYLMHLSEVAKAGNRICVRSSREPFSPSIPQEIRRLARRSTYASMR